MDFPRGGGGVGDPRARGKALKWPGWKRVPARKPLAVGVIFYTGSLLLWYAWREADVPPGMAGLLETMIYTCVGGYAVTSAYEAVRVRGEGDEGEWQEKRADSR